jgi:membrane protein YdbS with pleckstrin-like domain
MKTTAKQWTIVIRIIEALTVAVVVAIGWLTWSYAQKSGQNALVFGATRAINVIVLLLIREIAKKAKRKSEEDEKSEPNPESLDDAKPSS